MLVIRKSQDRGGFDHGWLKTFHSFSFSEYYDPEFMGFSVLRVINEDRITGGSGFATHPHRDMEIVTYVVSGALEHKDSMGNSTVIKPGEVQRMSAGTGVRHSEFNHHRDRDTHLLQIWLLPDAANLTPSYGQKDFSRQIEKEGMVLTVSPDGHDGSITINQDVNLYVGKNPGAVGLALPLLSTRHGWVQVISGEVRLIGKDAATLRAGDGVAISDENQPRIECGANCHFLFFDLP